MLYQMVKHLHLDAIYAALSDPTRRLMVERLRSGRMSVSQLGAPLEMTLAAVGKHVTVLERAGLVTTSKRGRVRECELDLSPLDDATRWIDEQRAFWNIRVDLLAAHLEENRDW